MRFKSILLATTILFSPSKCPRRRGPKYGPNKELCEQNLSIYIEFISKKLQRHTNHGFICLTMRQTNKNIYLHGPKIIRA